MFKTLRSKLILFIIAIITIIMVNITYFFTIKEINAKKEIAGEQMQRIAQNIATMKLLDRQEWNTYQNYINRLIEFNSDIIYVAVYDDRNLLRAHALNMTHLEFDKNVMTPRQENMVVKRLDEGAVADESKEDFIIERVNIQVGERIFGSVHVGFSVIEINDELVRGIRINVITGLFLIIIFSLIATLVSNKLTKPLKKLSDAILTVKAGNFDVRVQKSSDDEIGQLTENFNEMTEGMRERQIIEQLGLELGATFQIEKLAMLVRERIKDAIGAGECRFYFKNMKNPEKFAEITTESGEKKRKFSPIIFNSKLEKYFHDFSSGFMIRSAPDHILKLLNHNINDRDGFVIPIKVKDDFWGMLFFELPLSGSLYSDKQKQFALILSRQAALALENAVLYEDLREKERLQQELKIAREVQQKLLPSTMPDLHGLDIAAVCIPAREVGGDYFDFYRIDQDVFAIAIADVCGKGTSASFFMAQLKGMMIQLVSKHRSPAKLLIELNEKLFYSLPKDSFITMIYAMINLKNKTINFARAGHNPVLITDQRKTSRFLTPHGIGLGLESGDIFKKMIEEKKINLNNQNAVVFFTDGLTELMNRDYEYFGEERLVNCIKSQTDNSASDVLNYLIKETEYFGGDHAVVDDITVIIIKNK